MQEGGGIMNYENFWGPGFFGDLLRLAIFRELGSTGNYLRGVFEKLNFF